VVSSQIVVVGVIQYAPTERGKIEPNTIWLQIPVGRAGPADGLPMPDADLADRIVVLSRNITE
jgi:hypothetical protein